MKTKPPWDTKCENCGAPLILKELKVFLPEVDVLQGHFLGLNWKDCEKCGLGSTEAVDLNKALEHLFCLLITKNQDD